VLTTITTSYERARLRIVQLNVVHFPLNCRTHLLCTYRFLLVLLPYHSKLLPRKGVVFRQYSLLWVYYVKKNMCKC